MDLFEERRRMTGCCAGISRISGNSIARSLLQYPERPSSGIFLTVCLIIVLAGTLAVTMLLLEKGASVVRTHDVAETRDVIRVYEHMEKTHE